MQSLETNEIAWLESYSEDHSLTLHSCSLRLKLPVVMSKKQAQVIEVCCTNIHTLMAEVYISFRWRGSCRQSFLVDAVVQVMCNVVSMVPLPTDVLLPWAHQCLCCRYCILYSFLTIRNHLVSNTSEYNIWNWFLCSDAKWCQRDDDVTQQWYQETPYVQCNSEPKFSNTPMHTNL